MRFQKSLPHIALIHLYSQVLEKLLRFAFVFYASEASITWPEITHGWRMFLTAPSCPHAQDVQIHSRDQRDHSTFGNGRGVGASPEPIPTPLGAEARVLRPTIGEERGAAMPKLVQATLCNLSAYTNRSIWRAASVRTAMRNASTTLSPPPA